MTKLSEYLNGLAQPELNAGLHKCCAASAWVKGMAAAAPFKSDAAVEAAATRIWNQLDRQSWLEAFAAHPRIGDVTSLRSKFANTQSWASREQSGVSESDEETIQRLAVLNHEYFEKFGFIFIICATGKSAAEMLAALEARLPNDERAELPIAAAEQLQITLLRLRKLIT